MAKSGIILCAALSLVRYRNINLNQLKSTIKTIWFRYLDEQTVLGALSAFADAPMWWVDRGGGNLEMIKVEELEIAEINLRVVGYRLSKQEHFE